MTGFIHKFTKVLILVACMTTMGMAGGTEAPRPPSSAPDQVGNFVAVAPAATLRWLCHNCIEDTVAGGLIKHYMGQSQGTTQCLQRIEHSDGCEEGPDDQYWGTCSSQHCICIGGEPEEDCGEPAEEALAAAYGDRLQDLAEIVQSSPQVARFRSDRMIIEILACGDRVVGMVPIRADRAAELGLAD